MLIFISVQICKFTKSESLLRNILTLSPYAITYNYEFCLPLPCIFFQIKRHTVLELKIIRYRHYPTLNGHALAK